MKRKEFKENLFAALDNDVDDITSSIAFNKINQAELFMDEAKKFL